MAEVTQGECRAIRKHPRTNFLGKASLRGRQREINSHEEEKAEESEKRAE